MKREIKDKWLAALRSGDYTQGVDRLVTEKDDGSRAYCCLGVLCDLAVKDGVIEDAEAPDFTGSDRIMRYGTEWSTLPEPVKEWAGLEDSNPDIPREIVGEELSGFAGYVATGTPSIAEINDSGEANFNRIADIIEEAL